MNSIESELGRRIIPLTKWSQYHSWPSTAGLRHLVFFSSTNGFEQSIRRVGSRVLIDEAAFFNWVDKFGVKKADSRRSGAGCLQ